MSAAEQTERPPLGPVARAAARGELPSWASAGRSRREHIARVAALMGEWATALGLGAAEVERWTAAAWLHDVLREESPEALRRQVPEEFRDLAAPALHGPAAAERLRGEADDEVLDAVRYHTLGHTGFGRLGRALFLADFLEPGRKVLPEWRAALRARMPHEMDAVLREVVASRRDYLRDRKVAVHPCTLAFYRQVLGEEA